MTERRYPFIPTPVIGIPAPQGSKTVAKTKDGRSFLRDDNPRTKPWREQIVSAIEVVNPLCEQYTAETRVHLTFVFDRPKTVPVSKRWKPTAKGSGDIDKLARAALDALTTSGVISDDAIITTLAARKMYVGDRLDPLGCAGLVIRVTDESS